MAVYECARCNALAYSASRDIAFACAHCGATRARVLDLHRIDSAADLPRDAGAGDHCGAVHRGPDEAAALAVPFILAALERGDPVVAQMSAAQQECTAARLGARAAEVSWVDADEAYASCFEPEAAIERLRELAEANGGRLAVVGGPSATFAALYSPDTLRHYEHLSHELAVELGLAALCLYDADALDARFLTVEGEAHPIVAAGGELRRNASFIYSAAAG